MVFFPQIISAIIAATVAFFLFFMDKIFLEKRRRKKAALLTLLWVARALNKNLCKSMCEVSYMSMESLVPFAVEILQYDKLSKAFDMIEDVFISWERGVYKNEEFGNHICAEAHAKLEQAMVLLYESEGLWFIVKNFVAKFLRVELIKN